jgi:hypothetical protein
VLELWTVAGFAGNAGMFAFGLLVEDIGVTPFAGLVSGVGEGERGDLRDGIGAKVSVAAEAVGNEIGSYCKESQHARQEDSGDAEQMFSVLHDVDRAI